MGMISDMFCSSPASTATTRKTKHHETSTYNISSTTPKLIRVFSSPCRSINDVALNPNKPAAADPTRHEYKQLLQRHKTSNSTSCYGDSGRIEQRLTSRRRKSSADASCDLRPVHPTTADNKLLSDSARSRTAAAGGGGGGGGENTNSLKHKSTSASDRYHDSNDKVVVLWVSLHCKGCEAKVRKHISKMKGVKSFSTDRMSKRVTIISNMDPYDVLASVSTVKHAYFWPSSFSSSSSYYYSPSSSSSSSSAALLTLTR